MPVFDFKCKECDHKEEILIIDEDEELKCSKCGGEVEKLLSYSTSFHLKGHGWFKDGYTSKKV